MHKITKLAIQKRNKTRVNIYLNGEYAFPLSLETVLKHKLQKGQSLKGSQLTNLLRESHLEKLISKIINFLSYRPRSRQEITNRLYKYTQKHQKKRKKLISITIQKLEDKGLINDLAFATWFIEQRQAHRPRSAKKIFSELLSKGVDIKIIRQALKKTDFNEIKQMQKLIKKYLKNKPLNQKTKQKLIQYLLRKGFLYSNIKKTLQPFPPTID